MIILKDEPYSQLINHVKRDKDQHYIEERIPLL